MRAYSKRVKFRAIFQRLFLCTLYKWFIHSKKLSNLGLLAITSRSLNFVALVLYYDLLASWKNRLAMKSSAKIYHSKCTWNATTWEKPSSQKPNNGFTFYWNTEKNLRRKPICYPTNWFRAAYFWKRWWKKNQYSNHVDRK